MWYGGKEVLVGEVVGGTDVPQLSRFDWGVTVGDYAIVDGDPHRWDGTDWVPSSWGIPSTPPAA